MSDKLLTMRKLADDVRKTRTRLRLPGRLACAIVECPTCHVERGEACISNGEITMSVHAARARHASDLIEAAP